jgi:hypothetical protein
VDHPFPGEVSVTPPPLPAFLSLDRIRTGTRVSEASGERRTVVEFTFIPGRGGLLSLPPFVVGVPGRRAFTPELTVYVRETSGSSPAYRPRLVWETRLSSLRPGEAGEIRLILTGWDPEKAMPGPFPYHPPAPPNAILEELPLSTGDREGGVLLRLLVIPLGGTEFALPARTLGYGAETLEVPALGIPISPPAPSPPAENPVGPAATPGPAPAGGTADRPGPEEGPPGLPETGDRALPDIPFPLIPPGRFFPFRETYDKTLDPVRRFWEAGRRAEALALLRRSERDALIGPALVPVRRAAEASLGLMFRKNEPSRGLLAAAGIALLILPLGILVFFRFRRKSRGGTVTSPAAWGYRIVFITLIPALGLGVYGFYRGLGGSGGFGKGKSAVVRETGIYRVPAVVTGNPGEAGEGSAVGLLSREPSSAYGVTGFAGGEPVLIRSAAGSWAYVESFDGRAGWVPEDRLIPY